MAVKIGVFSAVAAFVVVHWVSVGFAATTTDATTEPQASQNEDRAAQGDEREKSKAKKTKRRKKKKSDLGLGAEIRTDASAGYLSGRTYRALPGGVAEVGLDATLAYRTLDFAIEAPLVVEHSQTSAPLVQSRGRAGLEVTFRRFSHLRPSLGVQIAGVARPNWLDYYQPILSTESDEDRSRSSRYSYLQRQVRAEVASKLGAGHHLRLKYRYTIRQFPHDPNFQPYERPMHLTPGDTLEHQWQAGWRWFFNKHNVALGTGIYLRDYLYRFSRDAGTGASHAGPGGAPPNALQRFWGVVPELGFKWQLSRTLELKPKMGVAVNRDTFDNYYTWLAWLPGLSSEWTVSKKVVLSSSASADLRRYTSSGYQTASNHPRLDYGRFRQDDFYNAELSTRYLLTRHLHLSTEVSSLIRRTNFPDYVPGVHPGNTGYKIDWDYKNVRALVQLTYRVK